MSHKAQMLKGLIEGCILEIISHGETYGYEITHELNENGFPELNEGTVYPVLMRLSKKGYVTTEVKVSKVGPKRKYFSISSEGEAFLKAFKEDWMSIETAVNHFMKGAYNE